MIPRADSEEALGRRDAHHVIRLTSDRARALHRAHRCGEDEPARLLKPKRRERRECRHTGGEPIIDEHDRSSLDARWRPIAAKASQPSLELRQLLPRHFLDVRVADVEHPDRVLVEKARAAGSDRANAQLLMARSAELARDEEIERRVDRARHLVSHRDAPARDGEHERILVANSREPPNQLGRQSAPRLDAIREEHHPPFPRYLVNQAAASSDTTSRVPGSSKRCDAPWTISSFFAHRSCAKASSLSGITGTSRLPTMSSVGALTLARCSSARSGRPPRDTTASTSSGIAAAATSAAAAPVLAPKYPTLSDRVSADSASQRVAASSRFARKPMSNRK